MTKQKKKRLLIDFLLLILLITVDRISKYLIITQYQEREIYPVIDKVLSIQYYKNHGGVWGILDGQYVLFIFITLIVLLCLGIMLVKLPQEKRFTAFHIGLTILAAGATGNMIDRFSYHYVIDFVKIELFHFPIFNVSDIYITFASLYIIFLLIFKYRENDLKFMDTKQVKYRKF